MNGKKLQNPPNLNKSFEVGYNKTLQAMELRIADIDGMFPFYLQDPEAGRYKIIRTNTGKLQMVK